MSKFEDLSFDGKCDVCGKESKVVVCASSMGAISYSYCKECLNKGLEPYKGMVAYISCAGKFPDDINSTYANKIRMNLKELNKTEEEFIADCDKSNEEFEQWCRDKDEFTEE